MRGEFYLARMTITSNLKFMFKANVYFEIKCSSLNPVMTYIPVLYMFLFIYECNVLTFFFFSKSKMLETNFV